ncbi:cell division control protein 42 homolog [Haliotis cracherodii]|uniref:cell division control protein 42 homolog n=1 Tax=Haliotis cracherodii TaxID=6455 RepID=UPI0039EB676A
MGKSKMYRSFDKSNIKCVLVGDTTVGKSCLARRLAAYGFSEEYTPTMFDNYAATTTVDGKPYVLSIFDTAGQEEFDRLRALAYMNCDVFLICFSVGNPDSIKSVLQTWVPEVTHYAPDSQLILVGTQVDMRDEAENKKNYNPHLFVQTKEGLQMASKIGAEYVECSAMTEAGTPRLKEVAVDSGLRSHRPKDDTCCATCEII